LTRRRATRAALGLRRHVLLIRGARRHARRTTIALGRIATSVIDDNFDQTAVFARHPATRGARALFGTVRYAQSAAVFLSHPAAHAPMAAAR